ncbi:MAG: type II toxin-antitoxin system VapC family toxin [Alphaproteobacteria bacterium]|nr:MAG: type II toxin-antitoxin system VapC family toxin [Alphaproteobacteria bacterium]
MIVVDASLAAKWVLWEADSAEAFDFLTRHQNELAAPELIFIEVAGAIVRRANEDKSLREAALRALDKWTVAWTDHVIQHHRVTQRRIHSAAGLAIRLGHPLKDCVYLGLAMELKCPLVTCDAVFTRKAVSLYPDVRLLEDYSGASPTSS